LFDVALTALAEFGDIPYRFKGNFLSNSGCKLADSQLPGQGAVHQPTILTGWHSSSASANSLLFWQRCAAATTGAGQPPV
jgi:hypothetical protein